MRTELIITCEHASRAVPPVYAALFRGQQSVLRSHRGYDPHARELAQELASHWNCELFEGQATRLLVELNRSLWHPALFSEFSRGLSRAERRRLLDEYYHPYRTAVENHLRQRLSQPRTILHVGVHTFTPVWHGQPRTADVGLLYDSARSAERQLMEVWQGELRLRLPGWRIRRNYPYLGRTDGFTTHLRKVFPPTDYLGIEIEVRNTLRPRTANWQQLVSVLVELGNDFRQADRTK